MSLGKRVRSSSSQGRLQTQQVSSIISDLGATAEGMSPTSRSGRWDEEAPRVKFHEDRKDQPQWLVQELLRQNRRRHTVTLGDKPQIIRQQHHSIDLTHRLCSLKLDEISLDNLQKLKLAFEEFEAGGLRCIDEKSFERVVKTCLGLTNSSNAHIQSLFKKIDYSGQGRISWGQFCSHMLHEYKQKEESRRRSRQVALALPATVKTQGSGVPIVNIHSTPDGAIVTMREDGAMCFWSPELKPQRTKHMFNEGPTNRKSKWASDFTVMPEYNKLLIATGDRELQLYELYTLEAYCQISALDAVPLTVDYSYTGSDKCCILYGDMEGCVTVILISSVGDTLRLWNKLAKTENIPNVTIDTAVLSPNVTFVRWKVHRDWVTQAKYFPGFQAVVSSSNEDSSSLVIGRVLPLTDAEQQLNEIREACYEGRTKKVQLSWTPQVRASGDQTVFSVYKGVTTFDLCHKHSLLVTGGRDRLVRTWNPHCSGKATGVLKGHSAPVVYLCISSEDSQLFSVSIDNTVKIWDVQDQCCLFTADPKASRIHGDISACSYVPAMKSLFIAADCVAVLSLKIRPQLCSRLTVSHNEPVICCGYSEEFRQVVSCTERSVVKVWDFDTGCQVLEFGGIDDLSSITCMTFDLRGRRLITGGKDGCLKIWNFNTGQCLKTLKKGSPADGGCHELCACIFLKVHSNCFVMSVGRDRKIDIYPDVPEDLRRLQEAQPPWQDDRGSGHREDILCVEHCPPSLLATGAYDGEIIVWNVVSGCIQSRFVSPPPAEYQNIQGLDSSVTSLIFVKLQQFPSASLLICSGAVGFLNLWNVHDGGTFVSSFQASRFHQKITKLAKSEKNTLLCAADQIGYVFIYDMETFAPEQQSPTAEIFWRAHTTTITGLQIVDSDQVVLTSSADYTVRLWSARGEFIGTFGQSQSWSVHVPSSWAHPAVPYEVLTDPQSTPALKAPGADTHLPGVISPDGAAADGGELELQIHNKLRLPPESIGDSGVEED